METGSLKYLLLFREENGKIIYTLVAIVVDKPFHFFAVCSFTFIRFFVLLLDSLQMPYVHEIESRWNCLLL